VESAGNLWRHTLIVAALAGKDRAIAAYDEMLWKIRAGYVVVREPHPHRLARSCAPMADHPALPRHLAGDRRLGTDPEVLTRAPRVRVRYSLRIVLASA
jgi:hypothetical protein